MKCTPAIYMLHPAEELAMTPRIVLTKLLGVCGIIVLGLLAYGLVIRPWILQWGATAAEVRAAMPGDGLVAAPDFNGTRAVTINASPEAIYPWLAQWGFGKAGFYGYDLLEGIGSPTGITSAQRIIPEYQNLQVGDVVKMNDIAQLNVYALEPNQYIVLIGGTPDHVLSAMTWQLEPIDATHTRLINRYRFFQMWNSPLLPLTILTEFGDSVAIRKIMLGIQNRAEGRVEALAYQAVEIALWLLSISGFFVAVTMIIVRREWGRAWLVAAWAACVFLIVFFVYPPLWVGALLMATLITALVWVYRTTTSVFAARLALPHPHGKFSGRMRGQRA